MQNVNTYNCEGCRYFYADWMREKYYCRKETSQLRKPYIDCSKWDDSDIDDEWIEYLEQEAIRVLYTHVAE